MCSQRKVPTEKSEYRAVCGGSHPQITGFITELSLDAGSGYEMTHEQHRDAAMTSARSASSAVAVGRRPDWSLVIEGRHTAFRKDKVITDGFVRV